uniref:Translational regulator CsrA n=1 Tax=Schlesneria paludicola TaxID=360056 RepID=A0A7C2JY40_9PLAN
MLVLTRRESENVLIGDQEITIKVLEIRGGRVRLGIEAPQDMTIRRGELLSAEPSDLQLAESQY